MLVGVCSAGFTTTVQPAARAGAIFHAAISSLVVANGQLYYSYQSGIARMGPTDMQPTPLLSGFSWTSDAADISLAVDDSCVFWAALSNGPAIMAGPR